MSYINFGKVYNHLGELLDAKKITQTKVQTTLGLEPRQIRFYRSQDIRRFDMFILTKFCFLLDCEIGDILEYVPPYSFQKENPGE